jgi:amino acid adenylation domain-containing protein
MRSIDEIFEDLQAEKIRIWIEDGKLRYRAPKGGLEPSLKQELIERKQEIMSAIPNIEASPNVIVDKDSRYEPFPLTDIQQAYWVGRSGVYDDGKVGVHGYLEIENAFDIDRLNKSWNRVVQRHEMLRAVVTQNGEQKILEEVPNYHIELTDMKNKSPAETTDYLKNVFDEMSHQVLSAESWPLFDIRATQLEENRVRLHVSLDLLMADLWSLFIVFQDWADYIEDEKNEFPPLEISFRDYVLAEQDYRSTEAYKKSEQYWFNRLETLPLGPDLPLAQSTEGVNTLEFQRHDNRLSVDSWRKLKEKAKTHGITSSGILFAAYSEILGRWSKSADFNLNLTLFNRMPLHPQINKIVGDFTTTVLLEVNHNKSESFIERGKRLQQQLWHDLDNRSVNAVQVLREMARRRGGFPRPAMPVVFSSALGIDALDEGSPGMGQFGSQLGNVLCTISQTPQVWIDHQAVEQKGELLLNWDGIEALFPEGMLGDMFGAYFDLLQRLANSNEEWERTDRALLPDNQVQKRKTVNSTEAEVSQSLLHELFLNSCQLNENNIAIITDNKTILYGELKTKAIKIAHRLKSLGAKPNILVAIVMEKGWEQIAATLGVLMSGAAYVPIDPGFPEERRFQLFDNADVKISLTQSWINERITWPEKMHCLSVDDQQVWEKESEDILPIVQKADDLAYVIYTSGSTGLPKGVMIDHQGAVNTILDINERYSIDETDRVLALSALSFDLSVYDVFGLLAAGGAIIIPDAQKNKDTAYWAKLMIEHQVSVWNTVPALLQMLVEYIADDKDKRSDALKLAMLSGDWIPVSLPEKVKPLWPGLKLMSQGGATEASIWSIAYEINEVDPQWKSIPYGKPLKNQTYHVLNKAMESCPDWVTGQLYIGGIGLAKGYWKDGVKTSASFITHLITGERLYKTGDLGRYLPDGNIEFLGREDFQVKVNGYRIELGEVESALLQHSLVKEVIVTTVEGSQDTKRLAAYVVPHKKDSNKVVDSIKAPVQGLTDLEKLQFKLEQRSVRKIESNQNSVKLRKPEFDDDLRLQYLRHRSYREYLQQPVSFDQFSDFMASLLQMPIDESPLPKYRYPSAGSLYPVQTYIYIKPERVEGIKSGVYYYHPAEHDLVLLSSSDEVDEQMKQVYQGFNAEIFDQSAFALFSIGELDAIEPLYGEWAKDFCYIESGYIGQLLMDKAPEYELGLCPIGKLEFDLLKSVFGWHSNQMFVQGFLGGGISLDQIQKLTFPKPAEKVNKTENIQNELDIGELRDYLQQKLPKHMIPSSYVILESFPLSANGKLDRNNLPKLDLVSQQKNKEPSRLPSTNLEKKIAELVAQVLQIDRVGMNDNLFDLGADSVAIVRLNNQLIEEFSQEIPIVEMFQYPTVNFLASFLKESEKPEDKAASAQNRAQQIRQARKRRVKV